MNDEKSGVKDRPKTSGLTHTAKKIIVGSDKSTFIDQTIIKKKYCHALNFSKLPKKFRKVQLSVGVTSPNKGDGKTLTAANFAISVALAYKKKTVLIDMNMVNPSLHRVFGTNLRPGLVESFQNGSIFLSQTKIDQLFLLPAGRCKDYNFGLDSVIPVRDILYSLQREFEIIVVDMSSVLPIDDFPVTIANELDGLMVVIDSNKTKYADVKKMFNHIDRDQALGFIMNNSDS